MSFEENIILKIRREFSGNEKYRLFLKHLDDVEDQLRKERQKYTDLLKTHQETKEKLKELRKQFDPINAELSEYKATEVDKKFVRMAAYKRLDQTKTMWETRFWEIHKELQKFKEQVNPINQYQKLPQNETEIVLIGSGPDDPRIC